MFNWENEIEKFAPNLKFLNLTGVDRKTKFKNISKYDIVITSYALIRRDIEEYKKKNSDILFLMNLKILKIIKVKLQNLLKC